MAAGEAFERDAPEREHVRARIDAGIAARLLGRHVPGRADGGAGARPRGRSRDARDAEIEHFYAVDRASVEEDVARLDVAVEHAARVGRGERARDAAGERDRFGDVEAAVEQACAEVEAVEPFEDEVAGSLRPIDVAVGDVPDDVRMVERGEDFGLAFEARGAALGVVQHLHGDGSPARRVAPSVHRAHGAGACEPLHHETAADGVAGLHARGATLRSAVSRRKRSSAPRTRGRDPRRSMEREP